MAVELNFDDLTSQLDKVESDLYEVDSEAWIFATTLRATGLRAREVLELSRWQLLSGGIWNVKLEKREDDRQIPESELPEEFVSLLSGSGWPGWVSYASMNHRLRVVMPVVRAGSDSRRTVSHLWRYWFMRKLKYVDDLSVKYIADYMKHKSSASTTQYVYDVLEMDEE